MHTPNKSKKAKLSDGSNALSTRAGWLQSFRFLSRCRCSNCAHLMAEMGAEIVRLKIADDASQAAHSS